MSILKLLLTMVAGVLMASCASERIGGDQEQAITERTAVKKVEQFYSQSSYPSCTDPGVRCSVSGRVIYGPDDRVDWYDMADKNKRLASGVVALFATADVQRRSDGKYSLKLEDYATQYNLCESENFRHQKMGADCSGSLISSNRVLTAGHCIKPEKPISDVSFVFGFRANNENDTGAEIVGQDNVFQGARVVQRRLWSDGTDWAIVELDRSVPASVAKPLEYDKLLELSVDQDVFVIGHPAGLPVKFADGAVIRDLDNSEFFIANLDTYGGNSGSPVFDERSEKIVGVLVRGETDYVPCKSQPCYQSGECECPTNCNVSNICPSSGCDGEEVMRISEIEALQ